MQVFIKKISRLLPALLWLLGALPLQGQDTARQAPTLSWQIYYSDGTEADSKKNAPNGQVGSRAGLDTLLKTHCERLHRQGYLSASVDTVITTEGLCLAYILRGAKYSWSRVDWQGWDKNLLSSLDIDSRRAAKTGYTWAEIERLREKILRYCENNGYPFAQLSWERLDIADSSLAGRWALAKNQRISFGTISSQPSPDGQEGKTLPISARYLRRYLGIKRGALYDERLVQKMKQRLVALPFISLKSEPYLLFIEDKADILLDLKPKNASKFDFLVGLQPNTNQQTGASRVFITGNVGIDLLNSFGGGERLLVSWQQLRPQSPQLRLKATLPYIAGTAVGLDANFELYKRDSSYIDINTELGGQFLQQGGNYWKVFWKNMSSNVLNYDTNSIKLSRRLPNILDSRVNQLGIEYFIQQLDNRLCPRKGFELKLNSAIGSKQLKKNLAISQLSSPSGFDYGSLYDSLRLSSYQWRSEAALSGFVPATRDLVLMGRLQGGYVQSSGQIFQQELFRIGGSKIQRGFDEESILATAYLVGSAELRLLLGGNSYLFLFGDGGAVSNQSRLAQSQRYIYGFGGGITIETKAGLFAVSYGLGGYSDAALQLRGGKLHFGYINRF